jgi:hypothetical protein
MVALNLAHPENETEQVRKMNPVEAKANHINDTSTRARFCIDHSTQFEVSILDGRNSCHCVRVPNEEVRTTQSTECVPFLHETVLGDDTDTSHLP